MTALNHDVCILYLLCNRSNNETPDDTQEELDPGLKWVKSEVRIIIIPFSLFRDS